MTKYILSRMLLCAFIRDFKKKELLFHWSVIRKLRFSFLVFEFKKL